MFKLYVFAAVFLFWSALAASLLQVQLAASPVRKMRVPSYRSVCVRPAMLASVSAPATAVSYN